MYDVCMYVSMCMNVDAQICNQTSLYACVPREISVLGPALRSSHPNSPSAQGLVPFVLGPEGGHPWFARVVLFGSAAQQPGVSLARLNIAVPAIVDK